MIACLALVGIIQKMEFVAHIKVLENEEIMQSVSSHCCKTASYAADCLGKAGGSNAAYLSGLLHDAGKCKAEFQKYLKDKAAV